MSIKRFYIKLGDICEITSSKRIFMSDYVSSGIPFYRSKEIIEKQSGKNIPTGLFISEEKYAKIKNKYSVPQTNDILLTSVGTLGIPYLVKEGEKFYFKDGNLIWIKKSNNMHSRFLYYFFISKEGKSKLENISIGTTQRALTIVGLKNLTIDIPSLNTQKQIASTLSSLDAKIELNNAINNNLEQQAQALFKSWFVENENPERKIIKAEDFFDISIGKTPPRKEQEWFSKNQNNNVIWVSISDMGSCGTFISDSSEYLTKEAISKFNIKIVPDNTILLSFKLTIGRIAISDGEIATNEAIAHFVTDKKEINEYLYCYLKNFSFQTMGSTSSIATAVNSKIIKAMPFILPAQKELNDFHRITKPIFDQIKANQKENKTLAELRDALLPKLMSGEIDVSNVKIDDLLPTDKLSFTKE